MSCKPELWRDQYKTQQGVLGTFQVHKNHTHIRGKSLISGGGPFTRRVGARLCACTWSQNKQEEIRFWIWRGFDWGSVSVVLWSLFCSCFFVCLHACPFVHPAENWFKPKSNANSSCCKSPIVSSPAHELQGTVLSSHSLWCSNRQCQHCHEVLLGHCCHSADIQLTRTNLTFLLPGTWTTFSP